MKRSPAGPSYTFTDFNPQFRCLNTGVVEVLGGVRDLEQLGRWLSERVYRHLLKRSIMAARGRAMLICLFFL